MRRKTAAAGRKLSFSAPVRESLAWRSGDIPTLDEVRQLFAPPLTLGTPDEARMAMDAAFDAAGGYSLLQHGLAMGQFGPVTSASEGSVSVSFQIPTLPGGGVTAQWYNQTPCGRAAWMFLRRLSLGGRYYGVQNFHPYG